MHTSVLDAVESSCAKQDSWMLKDKRGILYRNIHGMLNDADIIDYHKS